MQLRARLRAPGAITLAGAHNGLSARLAEEAGFEGIWASGFEISAAAAVPDANILTMTETLLAVRSIVQATRIPVIADCDNGFGNAVNVIHMVRQYENAGVAAVCVEDNVFPKRCSFYAGVRRELEDPREFAGKLRAAKDAQRTRDFCVVARTEALIAGWGMEEALLRGRAYADAGADLVLVHSKEKHPGEVLEFARRWDRSTPLVCVPTTYDDTTVTELHTAGFKVVIFANHGLRSAIRAMRETFATLRASGKARAVKDGIARMDDVYALVGVDEMKRQEEAYLPGAEEPRKKAVNE